MNKTLLALPLCIGASWAGTTYVSGNQTQPAYERLLLQMNRNSLFSFESVNYDSEFISSTAITEVRNKESDDQEVLFTLTHTINHSPVSVLPDSARFGAANIVTELATDSVERDDIKAFLSQFNSDKPLTMDTEVSIDGTTKNTITIADGEFIDENQLSINTSEATLNVTTNENGKVSGDGLLPTVVINDNGATVDTSQITLFELATEFSFTKLNEPNSSALLFDYLFQLDINEIKAAHSKTGDILARISDSQLTLEQTLGQDIPSVNLTVLTKEIESNQLPLQSFEYNGVVSGFSMNSLIENQSWLNGVAASGNIGDELLSERGLNVMREFIALNTKLAMSVNATTTDGNLDAITDLQFVGNGSADGYSGMATVGDLAKAFSASANVVADRALFSSPPFSDLLGNPFALLYLNIDENTVSLNATIDKLILDVSGRKTPLEFFAQEALQMPLQDLKSVLMEL